MQNPRQIKKLLSRSASYTLLTTTLVWAFLFALGIYKYHYQGIQPGQIAWLAARHLPWDAAMDKAAYIAGVGAAMVLMLGAVILVVMFLITEAMLFIARNSRGKKDG